jgi:hypothetical protein
VAISSNDKKILEEIVDTQGACLDSKRCQQCPFRAMCLPEFLYPKRPTQAQRLELALNILTHQHLVDEEMTTAEMEEFKWDKK